MQTAAAKYGPVNLLLVDDRAENRAALRAILTSPDYKLVEAASGPEALRLLVDTEFAVLLVDLVMPEMDGFELARLIQSRERTAGIPIVFVAGVATEASSMFRGYRAGAVDYLVKPLDPEIVRAKVAVFAELFRQRKRIEASLREKEMLLREVHHRVKNNLQVITSLLHLQGSTQEPSVQQLFAESEARVRSIALVHEALYQADSFVSIDIQSYMASVVAGLTAMYPSGAAVEVHTSGIRFPIDAALSIGLIVNELVTNALKYAFHDREPGTIDVSLFPQGSDLVLQVRDDGVGIPETLDVFTTTTTGFRLVHSMVDQLSGVLEIDRINGTTIHVVFPRPVL